VFLLLYDGQISYYEFAFGENDPIFLSFESPSIYLFINRPSYVT